MSHFLRCYPPALHKFEQLQEFQKLTFCPFLASGLKKVPYVKGQDVGFLQLKKNKPLSCSQDIPFERLLASDQFELQCIHSKISSYMYLVPTTKVVSDQNTDMFSAAATIVAAIYPRKSLISSLHSHLIRLSHKLQPLKPFPFQFQFFVIPPTSCRAFREHIP